MPCLKNMGTAIARTTASRSMLIAAWLSYVPTKAWTPKLPYPYRVAGISRFQNPETGTVGTQPMML